MAEYKNNIKIGIAFDKQKDIQGQLDSLIKSLNNTKINLDINLNNTDLVKKLENITKMADNFKSSFGGNISLGNVDQVINKTTSAMESFNGELLKTNIKTFNDIVTVTKSISTNIGEVTRQTEKFINESGQLQKIGETITTVTENSEKFKQSMNDIQKAMLSLESMKLNGLVDTNSIEKLKTDLNTVFSESNKENGIKFSDNELKNYLNQVKALENEEKKLKEIQDINNRELEATYKLQQDDLKQLQQLEQQREKELLQEQMLIERQAEAYKQIDVMKANGIISNSDIAKLESMVQKANSLKDMNKALSEIMTTSMMKESSIVTLSKQLDEAQVKLDKMKSTFGNKLPDGFIQSTESQINKLKEDLTKIDGMNFNGIKNSLNDINTGMKVTNNETRELVNSLKETNNNSFFGSMSSFLGKIGVFYGIQQVTQEISQQLKNAASYTIDMDKSMTNMQMITGKSKSDVGDIVNNYKQLGEQLHTTNSEMMRGMEEVTRAGFDGKEGESLMSASIMGSKLSGQTTEQVTQQLIAIKNAFNMTGEQMQNVVDMMSKMDNVSATSFKEIASAIQRTAFSAQEAGTPLSNLITYITTVSEKTRKSAETIGESFKTIYARYSNIKLGNLDEDGKTINDTETAMNRIGIAIRNNKGQFKEFDTVLQEFMQKFKSGQLSQVDYLAGIQALAGTRQRETLMALMENMDTLNQHQKEVAQSAGSAKKMMDEAYNQSLDARIQDLKRAFEGLYEKITNSEQLKWLVSEFTQLITALSNVDGKTIAFTATIGGLVLVMSKLSALNKTLIAGEAVTGLSRFIAVLSGMQTTATTINGVTNATKALQLAQVGLIAETEGLTGLKGAWLLLSTGIKEAITSSLAFMATPLGLAISAIAVAVGIAVTAFTSYKEHQAQLEQQSKNLKDAIDGVNESLKNGDTKGASKQLDKAKEEQVQLQKLYETRKRLEGMSEDQFYGKMGGADKAQSIALVQHQIDELTNSIKENGLTVNEETGTIKEYVEAQEQVANAKTVDTIKEQTKAQLEDRMNLEEAQGEYNNFIGTVQGLYTEYQTLSDQESLSADQKTRLSEVCSELQSKFTDLNVSVDENGVAHINNTPLIEDNISYLTSEGMTIETLTSIRLSDAKACSEWSIGNQQMTYQEVSNNIENYKAEIDAIGKLMEARSQSAQSSTASGTITDSAIDATLQVTKSGLEAGVGELESAKSRIDSIYGSIKAPINNAHAVGGGGDYMPSGESGGGKKGSSGSGKSEEAEAKKAQQEAIKAEKDALKEITDAYDKSKNTISNDLKEIELNEKMLGKATNDNFPQRVDLTNKKIKEQQSLLDSSTNQLMDLETQSYNTEEGQKALADAIEKANTEIINQKIAVEEAKQALQDLLQQQMKQVIEQEKNVAEMELEGKQEYDTKALEDYTKQQENAHNARIQSLDDELDALEKQNEEEEKSNELQEKRNDLKQKEMDLERLKGQQTIQTLQKQADGTYQFVYTYDKLAVEDKQKEVDEAKKELEDTRRKQEYEAEKQAIEDQKKSEEDLYKKKEDYLKKYADSLKEQQDLEKQRLDQYYSDMDKLSFNRLQELEQQYGQNWDEIAKTIQSKLSETESSFEQLTTIKLNFGTKAVQEALNSGDITTYLTNKRDQIDKSTKLDLQGIDSYIKSIDDSAQDLSETYDNILSIKDNNEITESDIKTRQVQANKVVNIDFDGLQKQIKNLQDANEKLEMELDSHYNKQLSRQKRAQQEELESLQKFSESYLTLSNKFLELLQVVYDYRFNNITTNVAGAVNEIVVGLNVISEAYESYAKAWNKMHPDDKIPSSIDTAQVQSDNSTYQKSVIDYQNSKLSLYNADVFEQYYKQIKNGITDNILTQLGNYSLPSGNSINTSNNSVVNNKNTTTSKTTQVTINQLDVNTKDAQSLLNQLLILVENKTKLS